jgi:hypothetical protein
VGKSHNLIGQGIFHEDQDFFLSLNCPECNEGQFRDQKSRDLHEKSLDLSNFEIFQHKILKSLCREGYFLLPFNELAIAQGPKIQQKNKL